MASARNAVSTGPVPSTRQFVWGRVSLEPQEYDDFLKWRPELPEALLGKGLLHAKQKLILYGPRKTFKSMLVCYLLHCWRYGVDFLDVPVPAEGVSTLYLQLE